MAVSLRVLKLSGGGDREGLADVPRLRGHRHASLDMIENSTLAFESGRMRGLSLALHDQACAGEPTVDLCSLCVGTLDTSRIGDLKKRTEIRGDIETHVDRWLRSSAPCSENAPTTTPPFASV